MEVVHCKLPGDFCYMDEIRTTGIRQVIIDTETGEALQKLGRKECR